jgi:glutathione S-transferase
MPTLQLYYSSGSASLVAHWLLIELGLDHELKPVDLQAKQQKSAEYLQLNPNGTVPTLVVDGSPVFESAAIAHYLATLAPQAGLLPAHGSLKWARMLQWLHFCTNQLQPAYRTWFYPSEAAGETHADAAKSAAGSKLETLWAQVDAHLQANGPYLLGTDVSVADFMLTMLMRWSRNMPKPADTWPANRAHALAMKARPSFKTLYQRENLTEWA